MVVDVTDPMLALWLLLAAVGCSSTPEPKRTEEPSTGTSAGAPGSPVPSPTRYGDGKPEPSTERPPHLLGGYAARDVSEVEIGLVAKRAVELVALKEGEPSLTLLSIERAASQVVAGTNFALEVRVNGKAGERTLALVVYRNLQGHVVLLERNPK